MMEQTNTYAIVTRRSVSTGRGMYMGTLILVLLLFSQLYIMDALYFVVNPTFDLWLSSFKCVFSRREWALPLNNRLLSVE